GAVGHSRLAGESNEDLFDTTARALRILGPGDAPQRFERMKHQDGAAYSRIEKHALAEYPARYRVRLASGDRLDAARLLFVKNHRHGSQRGPCGADAAGRSPPA